MAVANLKNHIKKQKISHLNEENKKEVTPYSTYEKEKLQFEENINILKRPTSK